MGNHQDAWNPSLQIDRGEITCGSIITGEHFDDTHQDFYQFIPSLECSLSGPITVDAIPIPCDGWDIAVTLFNDAYDQIEDAAHGGDACFDAARITSFDLASNPSSVYYMRIGYHDEDPFPPYGEYSIALSCTDECGSEPSCAATGLNFGALDAEKRHKCQCMDSCDPQNSGSFCNKIEFVADRLSMDINSNTLCEESKKCCCSCPNCKNHQTPPPSE